MSVKGKKRVYIILAFLLYSMGLLLLLSRQINRIAELKLSNTTIIWMGVFGVICTLLTMACVIRLLIIMFQTNVELNISEQDERNMMIRGKAAEYTVTILSILMLMLEGVLIVMGQSLAAFLIAITFMLGIIAQLFLIRHFDKMN